MPRAPEPRRRFFFCHLQKTAGTSLLMRLRRHFEPSHIYPHVHDGVGVDRVLSVPHLLERWRVRSQEIEMVTGHFPLCTTALLGGGFITLTVMRDPIERTLSFLRHHRHMHRRDLHTPLEELYDRPELFDGFIHNHMVKMLALPAGEMTNGALTKVEFRREHLEQAKEQLRRIDAFGLQHGFEEFCDDLAARFGFRLGQPLAVNVTRPVAVPKPLLDRIAGDNALDVELYAFACRLYAERKRRS